MPLAVNLVKHQKRRRQAQKRRANGTNLPKFRGGKIAKNKTVIYSNGEQVRKIRCTKISTRKLKKICDEFIQKCIETEGRFYFYKLLGYLKTHPLIKSRGSTVAMNGTQN